MEDNVIRIDTKQKTSVSSMTTNTSYLAATRAMEMIKSQMAEIMKSYTAYDFSQSAAAALKEMSKSTNYDISREIRESFNTIARQYSAKDMTAPMRESIAGIAKSIISVPTVDTSFIMKNIEESIKTMTGRLLSEQLRQIEQLDYRKIFSDIFTSCGSFKNAIDTVYEAIQEESSEEIGLEADFSGEEEIQEAIKDQINNPIGFQERVSKWTVQKIAKYFIIWQIICFLWANFAQPYFQEKIGVPVMSYVVSNVRELPQKEAAVVCQLKEDIKAVIIENTNYYYKVSFIDENGIHREGYVAKRNLKFIEEIENLETKENSEISK